MSISAIKPGDVDAGVYEKGVEQQAPKDAPPPAAVATTGDVSGAVGSFFASFLPVPADRDLVTTPTGAMPFHNFTAVPREMRSNPYYRREIHPVCKLQDNKNQFWTTELKGELYCGYCPYPIFGLPYPGVDEYDGETGVGVSNVVYCNLVCRKSHIVEMQGLEMAWRLDWLTTVACDVYGHYGDIPVIQKYAVFKAYGGPYTHEEYLQYIGLRPFPKLRELPFVPQKAALEEEFQDPWAIGGAKREQAVAEAAARGELCAEERLQALKEQKKKKGKPKGKAASGTTKRGGKKATTKTASASASAASRLVKSTHSTPAEAEVDADSAPKSSSGQKRKRSTKDEVASGKKKRKKSSKTVSDDDNVAAEKEEADPMNDKDEEADKSDGSFVDDGLEDLLNIPIT